MLRWGDANSAGGAFDPVTMDVARLKGDDVPCWMLDADYNGPVFMGTQVFFPRTSAWDNLKKALKATHEESVWDHLARRCERAVRGRRERHDRGQGDR